MSWQHDGWNTHCVDPAPRPRPIPPNPVVHDRAAQVLRKAFPGVLLEPDVCGLRALPEVGPMGPTKPCLDLHNKRTEGLLTAAPMAGRRHAQRRPRPHRPTIQSASRVPVQGTEVLAAAPPSGAAAPRAGGKAGVDAHVSFPTTCDALLTTRLSSFCALDRSCRVAPVSQGVAQAPSHRFGRASCPAEGPARNHKQPPPTVPTLHSACQPCATCCGCWTRQPGMGATCPGCCLSWCARPCELRSHDVPFAAPCSHSRQPRGRCLSLRKPC
jgi:hypothetical protein